MDSATGSVAASYAGAEKVRNRAWDLTRVEAVEDDSVAEPFVGVVTERERQQ